MAKANKVVAVRWLFAYWRKVRRLTVRTVVEALEWELGCHRPVSFAYQDAEHKIGPGIGLLVDLERSRIHRVGCGDVWTILVRRQGRVVLRHTRSTTVARRLGKCRLSAVARWNGYDYDEAWGYLAYKGVVVHRSADRRTRQIAREAAERVGLPYLGTVKGGMR